MHGGHQSDTAESTTYQMQATHLSCVTIKQKLKENYMGKSAARRRGRVVIIWLLIGVEFQFNALRSMSLFPGEIFSLLVLDENWDSVWKL